MTTAEKKNDSTINSSLIAQNYNESPNFVKEISLVTSLTEKTGILYIASKVVDTFGNRNPTWCAQRTLQNNIEMQRGRVRCAHR